MCAHLSMLVAKQIVHVFTLSKRQLEMSDGSLRERCGQTAEALTVLQPWVPVEPHEWQVQYWVWWGEWMAEPWRAHILGVGGGVVSKKLELSPNWGGAQGIQWWCPCDGGCWACPCDCVNMSLCHGPDPNGNIEPPLHSQVFERGSVRISPSLWLVEGYFWFFSYYQASASYLWLPEAKITPQCPYLQRKQGLYNKKNPIVKDVTVVQ